MKLNDVLTNPNILIIFSRALMSRSKSQSSLSQFHWALKLSSQQLNDSSKSLMKSYWMIFNIQYTFDYLNFGLYSFTNGSRRARTLEENLSKAAFELFLSNDEENNVEMLKELDVLDVIQFIAEAWNHVEPLTVI